MLIHARIRFFSYEGVWVKRFHASLLGHKIDTNI